MKTYYSPFLTRWNLGRTREWTGDEVVAVEDQDQRCRIIVDGRLGSPVRRLRNADHRLQRLWEV